MPADARTQRLLASLKGLLGAIADTIRTIEADTRTADGACPHPYERRLDVTTAGKLGLRSFMCGDCTAQWDEGVCPDTWHKGDGSRVADAFPGMPRACPTCRGTWTTSEMTIAKVG